MVDNSSTARARPTSPHWQIWRWHGTMAASILHRVAGVAIYAGLIILTAWVFALNAGMGPYNAFNHVLIAPAGKAVVFLILLALFFHLANGVRHLAWDGGKGFAPKTANATAVVAFLFALVAAVAFWLALNGRR